MPKRGFLKIIYPVAIYVIKYGLSYSTITSCNKKQCL